jgi:prolyl oligopeptidase
MLLAAHSIKAAVPLKLHRANAFRHARKALLWLTLGICTPVWAQPAIPRELAQPVAPVRIVTDTYHGVPVEDPYRYMENVGDPEVANWMKSQSDRARAVLDSLPARIELLKRVETLEDSVPSRVTSVSWLRNNRLFYLKRRAHEAQAKLYVRDGLRGKERLLVDPETISAGEGQNSSLHFYSASPNGRYVAYGISHGGSELVAMSVLDIASGKVLAGPSIDRTSANVIGPISKWSPDEHAFYFNRKQELRPGMPITEKYANSSVFVIQIPEAETQPKPVFGNATTAGPRLEPDELPFLALPRTSQHALAMSLLEISNLISLYSVHRSQLPKEPVPWQRMTSFEDKISGFAVHGDDLYMISGKDTLLPRVLKTSLAKPDIAHATVVLSEGGGVVKEIAAAADALYVRLLDGGPSRMLRIPYGNNRAQQIAMPFSGSIRIAYADDTRPGVLVELAGWTQASGTYWYDPSKARLTRLALQPLGPFDGPNDLVVHEVKVPSHDGAMVPLSIVHKRGIRLDGSNPTILAGYGAYGYSQEPKFDPDWLTWFERGGIYAVAHVRGGGELGEAWHRGGFQETKPNTWKDLIACAEYLIAERFTRSGRLGLIGGSAGGILVGRAMTERPDLFAAVVVYVGLLDTTRLETMAVGAGNTREFGSVKTESGFAALRAMSTYEHVKDQVRYPGVLFVHGVNDPRVPVWASAKTAARLQSTTASGRPVLLRLDYQAGHGIGSSSIQHRSEFVDTLAFMLWQFGDPDFQPPRREGN